MWYPNLGTLYNLTHNPIISILVIFWPKIVIGENSIVVFCAEIHNGTGHLIERQIHDIDSLNLYSSLFY